MAALTPGRWDRLQSLFASAVDLPAAERERFIARETGGDEELRRELSGMLAHHARAGQRIAQAVEHAMAAESSGDAWVGRRVGPYRIVREIGRGGMGLVFEARARPSCSISASPSSSATPPTRR